MEKSEAVLVRTQVMLGAHLVRGNRRARITEVEAYNGPSDPGSHAFRGLTERNRALFAAEGTAYVYLCYGVHWMLNVALLDDGVPGAALIRAATPLEGIEEMQRLRPLAKTSNALLAGPGRLAAAFQVTAQDYGIDLLSSTSELRIEPADTPRNILATPRIGLAKGKGDDLLWRFVDADLLDWVSHPRLR